MCASQRTVWRQSVQPILRNTSNEGSAADSPRVSKQKCLLAIAAEEALGGWYGATVPNEAVREPHFQIRGSMAALHEAGVQRRVDELFDEIDMRDRVRLTELQTVRGFEGNSFMADFV